MLISLVVRIEVVQQFIEAVYNDMPWFCFYPTINRWIEAVNNRKKSNMNEIDRVNWDELQAYDMQELLKKMSSSDERLRLEACKQVEDEISLLNAGYDEEALMRQIVCSRVTLAIIPIFIIFLERNIQTTCVIGILNTLSNYANYFDMADPNYADANALKQAIHRGSNIYRQITSTEIAYLKVLAEELLASIE